MRVAFIDVWLSSPPNVSKDTFFPELARQSYRWSFSFVFFLVEIILCVSLFFSIKKYINLR